MIKKLFVFVITILILTFSAVQLFPYIRQLFLETGIAQEEILIAGTGSMYPTFPKVEDKDELVAASKVVAWPQMKRFPGGIKLFETNYFSYQLQYGDIVEFENEKTRQISQRKYNEIAGFVKRVIGIADDSIEFRDGFVLLNNKILNEPYTAKPRSTYGGEFLPDCKSLIVPSGYVLVLGDNRKASLDSRHELGLVALSDIKYVLPWNNQEEYKKLWRDTKEDTLLAHTATLNPQQFIELLNAKRKEKKLKQYNYNALLSVSGKRRGYAMIQTNDFSTEASKSGVTLAKAVKESGYHNIIFAEVYTRGFYEAQELLENFLEFPETKKILYSPQYQDIGIAAILGEIDGCPAQVVVAHLGGYLPPNYSKEEKESWTKLIANLEEVIPSWRMAKEAEGIDQNKLDQLLIILDTRLANAKKIQSRMDANLWLTESEKKLVEDDKKLSEEAQSIIDTLSRR
ncbi:signal peptidase I [Candidatus Gottesmanbacteria bacterium]|nr:signal peptidase I [Candidatus Gottesmanbacteria bacterium]